MAWLSRWIPDSERRAEPEAISPGLEQLGFRVAVGALLFVVGRIALTTIPYFPQAWGQFLPVLLFVVSLLSVPFATVLTTFLIFWAMLYVSPATAVWFALFMLILSGIYEERLEHAILLAATPVLLLINLAFLPLFLAGLLFRARGGLVNGLGCAAAIAIAAALGQESLGSVVVTGLASGATPVISMPFPLSSILDFSWVRGLNWESVATELYNLATRWADTFARSPIVLAQVILWGFAPIVVYQGFALARRTLGLLQAPEWLRVLIALGIGILVGGLLLGVGYGLVLGGMPPRYNQALVSQLLWSSMLAFGIGLISHTYQLARRRELQLQLPRLVVPDLRALWQRRAAQAKPESDASPKEE